jgi:hypothetical protein
MDETNLLSLIRPWLDNICQITTKSATVPFCKFFSSKRSLRSFTCRFFEQEAVASVAYDDDDILIIEFGKQAGAGTSASFAHRRGWKRETVHANTMSTAGLRLFANQNPEEI